MKSLFNKLNKKNKEIFILSFHLAINAFSALIIIKCLDLMSFGTAFHNKIPFFLLN